MQRAFLSLSGLGTVEAWVDGVNVFLIQLISKKFNGLSKTLEVDNFPFPKEFDDIVDVRIIAKT